MSALYNFEAEVHMPLKEGYRVKLSEHNIGMFINGMVVFPPNSKSNEWKVFTPSTRLGKGYIHPVEFNGKKSMWLEIKECCINSVKQYLANGDSEEESKSYFAPSGDTVLTDIDDKPIDLSDIPF
jgi:hypothetical protein|tara:strand:+ start:186 stop:560 length:375 start_codon:yes stop_codon:yes gene_type:complete